jgi:hypothetical protein
MGLALECGMRDWIMDPDCGEQDWISVAELFRRGRMSERGTVERGIYI